MEYPLLVADDKSPLWDSPVKGKEGFIWVVPPHSKAPKNFVINPNERSLKNVLRKHTGTRHFVIIHFQGFIEVKTGKKSNVLWVLLYEDDRIKELNNELAKRVFKQWAIPAVQSGNRVKFCGRRIPVVSSRYLQYATTYAKWNHFVTPNLARNIQIGSGIPDQAYVDSDPVLFSFKDITTGKTSKEPTMATETEVIFDIEHLAKQNLDASSGTPLHEDFAPIKQQEPPKQQETSMPAANGEKKDKGADKDKTEKQAEPEKKPETEKKTKKASKSKDKDTAEKPADQDSNTVQPPKETGKASESGKEGTTEVTSKPQEKTVEAAPKAAEAEAEKPTKKRRAPSANPKAKKAKTAASPESPNVVLNVPAGATISSDGPKSSSTDASNKANVLVLLRKMIEHPKFDKSKNPLNVVPTELGTWPTTPEGKATLMTFAHIAQHYLRGELGYNTNSVDPELDAMFS